MIGAFTHANIQLSSQHKSEVREGLHENVSLDQDTVQLTAAEKQKFGRNTNCIQWQAVC